MNLPNNSNLELTCSRLSKTASSMTKPKFSQQRMNTAYWILSPEPQQKHCQVHTPLQRKEIILCVWITSCTNLHSSNVSSAFHLLFSLVIVSSLYLLLSVELYLLDVFFQHLIQFFYENYSQREVSGNPDMVKCTSEAVLEHSPVAWPKPFSIGCRTICLYLVLDKLAKLFLKVGPQTFLRWSGRWWRRWRWGWGGRWGCDFTSRARIGLRVQPHVSQNLAYAFFNFWP